jgi:uncharacterized protein YndB with AHSA1/START domain
MTEPLTLSARMAAPVKDVHRALTDPAALRVWLAEHAEVELPHRYEFWGRYTPEGDAPHQRPLHVDDHMLRFSWLLDGEDTTVEIRLEEETADSTVLTLSQTHFPSWDEVMAENTVRGMLHTYWSLATANLADHLEGRPLTPMCDFTSVDLRAEVLIDADRDTVFDALTNSEKFSKWFGVPVDIEPRVGGRFAMGGFDADPNPAKILALEPGRKMTTDWGPSGAATWELADSGGRTRLTFVQSGWDAERLPYGGWMGWLAGVAELRRFLELDNWRPLWQHVEMPGMPADFQLTGQE